MRDKIINFVVPIIVLILSGCHLFYATPQWILPLLIIIIIDLYLAFLLVCAAMQRLEPLPERLVALGMVPVLFLVLVVSFAELYAKDNSIKRVLPDSTTEEFQS